ncbi:AAA ATPase central domain protein [Planktothrix serta PCC 8927]|uniref:AAA ATPase central domain protein n=1 Tax=Planktothrix serta PCC 8927 TaxID=671068 RepID=A0A7Z9BTM7_9CYAN|nr:ATP-binding protein [Planktothrix serta]VXD20447.1 AAA ATPase central domain protein [Planktothrix serta PCC 8927]
MSTARHVIALLKSYLEGEEQHFFSVALQMAAHEVRQGHTKIAQEIQSLVDQAKERKSAIEHKALPTSLVQSKGELVNLVSVSYSETRLTDMVLPVALKKRLERILIEQTQRHRLAEYNLKPRRKILLVGPPGSGKSMTAAALAGELKLPLFTVAYTGLITKYMGDTANQLKLIFDAMAVTRGVYFFEEFDAISSERAAVNDVGELRRVLNSWLQFLENDNSQSLIIAATNHHNLLDKALFRRFDDVIQYDLPNSEVVRNLLEARLALFNIEWNDWHHIIETANGLSQAEVVRAADEAAKAAVISKQDSISEENMICAITERKKTIFQ